MVPAQFLVALMPLLQAEDIGHWPCFHSKNLQRNESGKTIWLQDSDIRRIALHKSEPRLPSSVRAAGTVEIEIAINAHGSIDCARAISGHPILRGAAIQAVKQWDFPPLAHGVQPEVRLGRVTFQFNTGSFESPK